MNRHQLRGAHWKASVFVHLAHVAKRLERTGDQGSLAIVAGLGGLPHVTKPQEARLQDRFAVVVRICEVADKPPRLRIVGAQQATPGLPVLPGRRLAGGRALRLRGGRIEELTTKRVQRKRRRAKRKWRIVVEEQLQDHF